MADVLDEAEAFIHATEICSVPKYQKATDLTSTSKSQRDSQVVRSNAIWAIDREQNKMTTAKGKKRGRHVGKKQYEYNTHLRTILMDVGRRIEIDRPFLMKLPVERRDSKLFCQFHDDIGHDTKDCRNLIRALGGLAAKRFLKIYLRRGMGDDDRNRKISLASVAEDEGTLSDGGFIAVISGGLASGGPTNQGRKDYARGLSQAM